MTPLKPDGWSSGMDFLTESRSFQLDPGYRLSVCRSVLKAWLLVLLQLNFRTVFRLEQRSTLKLNGRAIIRLIEDILIQLEATNYSKNKWKIPQKNLRKLNQNQNKNIRRSIDTYTCQEFSTDFKGCAWCKTCARKNIHMRWLNYGDFRLKLLLICFR